MSAADESDFQAVVDKKKQRKAAREPEVMEDVWAFSVDWDWERDSHAQQDSQAELQRDDESGTDLVYVKTLRSFRELRSWGETRRWYHGYSPARNLIWGMKDGKLQQFEAPKSYRKRLRHASSVPAEMLHAWRAARKAERSNEE